MNRWVKRGGILSLVAAPCVIWLTSCEVEEARFSPFTMEYQTRRSLVVLTGEAPIYIGPWESANNDVLAYLQQMHFVEPSPSPEPKWQRVYRFLAGRHGGWDRPWRSLNTKMVTWSEEHPEVAPYFWKTGFRLLRHGGEKEIEAGHVLLGELWEFTDSLDSLRNNMEFLEWLYKVDVLRRAPPGLPPRDPTMPRLPPRDLKRNFRGPSNA